MTDIMSPPQVQDSGPWTVEEAAKKLRMSRAQLYALVKERRVPFRKIGSRGVLFTQADLDAILDAALRPAVTR